MFSENHNKLSKSPTSIGKSNSPSSPMSPSQTKKGLEAKKKEEFVTEKFFIENFTAIFIGDLD